LRVHGFAMQFVTDHDRYLAAAIALLTLEILVG